MKEAQEQIKAFDKERRWDELSSKRLKDFLLNMCEEVGEAWTLIKWLSYEEQKEVIEKHKDEFKDFVGDQLFLILKIAYLLDIDADEAFKETLKEYEKRFPVEEVLKKKHGNPLAGGVDNK